MDLFPGSEPRNFISFRLGKESNRQPHQTSLEIDNATEFSPVAQSTTKIMSPGTEESDTGRAHAQQLAGEIAIPNLLPSAIEIIEENSS